MWTQLTRSLFFCGLSLVLWTTEGGTQAPRGGPHSVPSPTVALPPELPPAPPDTCHEDLRGQIKEHRECLASSLNTQVRAEREFQFQVRAILEPQLHELQALKAQIATLHTALGACQTPAAAPGTVPQPPLPTP